MSLINRKREEMPGERERVSMEPGGIYCRVFQINAQIAGAADKSQNRLG